jgi:7-carboxy-7-deazaguanine synthase
MKIKLVKNGIFPVISDKDGKSTAGIPATGLNLSGTIQGEGKLAGIPVLFIRTSGCNLRCTWRDDSGNIDICDTPYSSHNVEETEEWEVEDVVATISRNLGNISHLVISGGEPTIQAIPLVSLASALKKKTSVHLTLETNGAHYVPELAWHIDLFSISPKLRSSEPSSEKNQQLSNAVEEKYIIAHKQHRKNPGTIQKYINACMHLESYYGDEPDSGPVKRGTKDFQLKFVVSSEKDEQEIREDFLDKLGFVKNEDVLVMPLGSSPEKMKTHQELALKMALRNGWRYAHRIQLEVFGDKAGT